LVGSSGAAPPVCCTIGNGEGLAERTLKVAAAAAAASAAAAAAAAGSAVGSASASSSGRASATPNHPSTSPNH